MRKDVYVIIVIEFLPEPIGMRIVPHIYNKTRRGAVYAAFTEIVAQKGALEWNNAVENSRHPLDKPRHQIAYIITPPHLRVYSMHGDWWKSVVTKLIRWLDPISVDWNSIISVPDWNHDKYRFLSPLNAQLSEAAIGPNYRVGQNIASSFSEKMT